MRNVVTRSGVCLAAGLTLMLSGCGGRRHQLDGVVAHPVRQCIAMDGYVVEA